MSAAYLKEVIHNVFNVTFENTAAATRDTDRTIVSDGNFCSTFKYRKDNDCFLAVGSLQISNIFIFGLTKPRLFGEGL